MDGESAASGVVRMHRFRAAVCNAGTSWDLGDVLVQGLQRGSLEAECVWHVLEL